MLDPNTVVPCKHMIPVVVLSAEMAVLLPLSEVLDWPGEVGHAGLAVWESKRHWAGIVFQNRRCSTL